MEFKTNGEIISEQNWMVFRKIIFEVFKEEGEENAKPIIKQEIVLWEDLGDPSKQPKCVGKKIVFLDPKIEGDVEFEYRPELKKYVAVFNGGYIWCENKGLRDAVNELSGGQYQLDDSMVTVNYQGENVGIRVDLKLLSDPNRDTSTPVFYPLFYYEQKPGFIEFSEVIDGENHYIDWKICDQQYQGYDKYPRKFKGPGDWHSIQVRQDRDAGGNNYYYEYLVEGLPLIKKNISRERTSINIPPGTFYIGRIPTFTTQMEEEGDHPFGDPNDCYTLFGEISGLVFDPNDTCWTC